METNNTPQEKSKKTVAMAYEREDRNFLTVLESIFKDCTPYVGSYRTYLSTKIVQCKDEKTKKEYEERRNALDNNPKITHEDISLITGHNKTAVGRWLNRADVRVPNADTIARLSRALGVTCDFLLGIDGTPKKKTEPNYKAFEYYGMDPDAFYNLNKFYTETHSNKLDSVKAEQAMLDYDKAIEGLNLLLKEVNQHGRMDILSRIGYFLTQHRFDNYYYFESDGIDNLYDSLFSNIDATAFNEEHVRSSLDAFLTNSPRFTIDDKVLVSLDTIRDRLKEYKEQIDPDFFKPSDAPLFFPSKETHEFEESFNDDELIEDDNELIDIAFTGRDIDIE